MDKDALSTHFVEIQDALLSQKGNGIDDKYEEKSVQDLNSIFAQPPEMSLNKKFAVLLLGNAAPGGNNIFDGLLQYQSMKQNCTLVGYINGVKGVVEDTLITISEDSYASYRNLGGYDYLGRSSERLDASNFQDLAKSIKKHRIDGLILVGATHSLTDGAKLTQYFLQEKIDTNVVVVPATLDGNIRHTYLQSSLGFDTATKVYSQLIGNMLTDSASAIKYWYFIRLMGKDPSHLALECALKTHPNMVIISEESAFRGESF